MTSEPLKKYDFIDALRGLAVLGVVLVHSSHWVAPSSEILLNISKNGASGVKLFFMVSALTLCLSLRSRQATERFSARNFFIRRFFRIAPMYYCAILAYFFLRTSDPVYWNSEGLHWWQMPLTALFSGWDPQSLNAVVPGGWTVAVEMMFYLFLPFLFGRLQSIRRSVIFIVGSIIIGRLAAELFMRAVLPYNFYDRIHVLNTFLLPWFLSQLPVFGLGILAYNIFIRTKPDKKTGLLLLLMTFFIFLAALALKDLPAAQDIALCLGFFGLVVALRFHPTAVLVNPLTQWLGRISFSLYLVHFAVIYFLTRRLPVFSEMPASDGACILAFGLVLMVSALVAQAAHSYVEIPGIKLGGKLIQKNFFNKHTPGRRVL